MRDAPSAQGLSLAAPPDGHTAGAGASRAVHRAGPVRRTAPWRKKKPAALACGLFLGVLDGDSYAITVLRQNVSAAVTFIFFVEVHDVLA